MQSPRRKWTVDVNKDTQFTDAWFVLIVILVLAGAIFLNRFLSVAAGIILATTALAWFWGQVSLSEVTYEREFNETRAFIGETVEVTLRVTNRKFLPVPWLIVRDRFPADLPVIGANLQTNRGSNVAEHTTFWMIGPFQQIARTYTIECIERGFHRFGPPHLTSGDAFGFFNRTETPHQEQDLIVYPRLYSVGELRLPSHNPFGEIRVDGRLFEDPLRNAGIREWQAQDGLRRVHWKATARQQTLVSRVYESSEEHVIQIFLNVATLERHWHGFIPQLQERVISVAGSLALLATELRRPVGLSANGALPGSDQPITLLPGRSPHQLVRILELLAAITPFATKPIERLLRDDATRLSWGATIVLVTAIAHDDLIASLTELADSGRRVVLFTLARQAPVDPPRNVRVYHLPHLVDDLIAPEIVHIGLPTDGISTQ